MPHKEYIFVEHLYYFYLIQSYRLCKPYNAYDKMVRFFFHMKNNMFQPTISILHKKTKA